MDGDSPHSRIYLPAVIYLDGQEHWIVQYSNGEQGVLLDPRGVLLSCPTFGDLLHVPEVGPLSLEEEDAIPIDLDAVQSWLKRPLMNEVDPGVLADAWDLFSDLAASRGLEIAPADGVTERAYEKLFWAGSFAANQSGGDAAPVSWAADEAVRVRQAMRKGLQLLRPMLESRA